MLWMRLFLQASDDYGQQRQTFNGILIYIKLSHDACLMSRMTRWRYGQSAGLTVEGLQVRLLLGHCCCATTLGKSLKPLGLCHQANWHWCKIWKDNGRLWKRCGLPCIILSVSTLPRLKTTETRMSAELVYRWAASAMLTKGSPYVYLELSHI